MYLKIASFYLMVFNFLYSCSFRLTEEQTHITGKTPDVLIRYVIQMSMVNVPIADACVKPHEPVKSNFAIQ